MLKSATKLSVFAIIFLIVSCKALELDTQRNCYNQSANCFKWDKTKPKFMSATPVPGTEQTTLPTVTLIFSEELANGTDLSAYKFSQGKSNGLTLVSVQKIANYTYKLTMNGAIQNSAPIEIDFSGVKDFSGNSIDDSDTKTVTYQGNVSILLDATFDHAGVSTNAGAGGYGSLNISFKHNYTTDITNNNSYEIRLTAGLGATCATGTLKSSGTFLAPGTTINFNIPAVQFAAGNNMVYVCLTNQTNTTVKATGVATIYRDDAVPITSYDAAPYPIPYQTPKVFHISCNGYSNRIAYTTTNQTGAPPPNTLVPTFNLTTGAIGPGDLYSTSLTADNSVATNPTYSKFSWRCIDIAGNQSVLTSNILFYVDLNVPAVNISLAGGYHDFVSTGGYTTTQFNFTTDQAAGEPYKIIRGGTTGCTPGGGETVLVGPLLTPATGTPMNHVIPAASFTAGTNNVAICVYRTANLLWGAESVVITRDDIAPTVALTVAGGSYGYVQLPIFTCSDNADKVAYTIVSQFGATAPITVDDPTFNAAAAITNGQLHSGPITIPDLSTSKIRWRCIDKAGNLEAAIGQVIYTIDSAIPNVTLVSVDRTGVTNNAGGYPSATVIWNTDRAGLTYSILRGSTNCVGGTSIATGTTVTGSNIVNVLGNASFPTNGTAYDVKICVSNFIGQMGYPATPITITRDNTIPTMTLGVTTLTNPGDGTITLGWTAATDTFTAIEGYDICQSTNPSPGAGSCSAAFTSTYQAGGGATSILLTGLSPATTYYFMVRARDSAGNRDTNVIEKKSKLTLSVTVAGYSSAVPDFRVTEGASTVGFTSNITQSFSNVYTPGQAYAIQVVNQPGGQNCAFIENQFGNIYADTTLNVKCATGYLVTGNLNANPPVKLNYRLYQGKNSTVAGNSGTPGANNATGAAATFNFPEFLAHLNGSLYVADSNNYRIRRVVTATNAVTTLAGTGAIGVGTTADDGPCATASLGSPMGVATDGTNLYVAEYNLGRIRKLADVNGTCQATTFAGTGTNGFADGPGTTAQFSGPRQIVINQDYIFVADNNNNRIRRVALATGIVDTLVGNGAAPDSPGTGTGASIQNPDGLALIGSMLYATTANHRIMAINISTGVATIVAGDGTAGNVDAAGVAARLNGPVSMTTDGADLYVAEYYSHVIRRIEISKNYRVTAIAGAAGLPGDVAGVVGPIARFNIPHGIVTDGRNFFVTNHTAHTIRKLTDNGLVGYWAFADSARDYASDTASPTNATPVNAPALTLGRYNEASGAYLFNGTNQYFTSTAPITVANACNVTMAAWYKPNSLASNQGIVYNGNSGSSGFGLMYNSVNGIQVLLGGVGSLPASGGYQPTLGQWIHLTARCQNGLWAVFANGHKVSEVASSASATAPVGFTIGRDSSTLYTNGSITDVRVYNRALGEGEINELAQDASPANVGPAFNSRAIGLLTHYEFNNSILPSGPIGTSLSQGGVPTAIVGKDGESNGARNFASSYHFFLNDSALPKGAAPRTLCTWIKPISYPANSAFAGLVQYGANANNQKSGLHLYTDTGGVKKIAFVGRNYDHLADYAPPLNTWSHLCATFDGTNAQLYVNGVATGAPGNLSALNTGAGNVGIGADLLGGPDFFNGGLDDVRIYNNALSAFQIRQLATQVPAGLVARYDFSGDRNDVSGFAQDLNNNGANLTTDRFGTSFAAAAVGGSSYFDGAMANFPLGSAPRTVCAWSNPSVLFNGTFSEVVMYGTPANSWGFGMDASGGLPNGRIFVLDTAGDMIHNQPHGLSIWRHVCATYGTGTEALFVDGYPVVSVIRGISTASGQLFIGRGAFGLGDYFNGNIDDVRIYNRALSIPEIQALQQQPNKRIFVTTSQFNGNLRGAFASAAAGADNGCNVDGNKPATGSYKAMLVDGTSRTACTSANCATGGLTENWDWVLRNNISYVRPDLTHIFTNSFNTAFSFAGVFSNSINGAGFQAWTGLATDWTISANECVSWTSNGASLGQYGQDNATGGQAISANSQACSNLKRLYCVEQ